MVHGPLSTVHGGVLSGPSTVDRRPWTVDRGLDDLAAYQFRVRPADGEAFAVLHFYDPATVEVFFNFLQTVDVDNGTAVNADKHLGIENLLEFSNAGRTYELVILGREDSVVARCFEVHDLIDREVEKLF